MQKEISLIPLFEKFIKDCKSGRRLKPDGRRIRMSTIVNYQYVCNHLKYFSETYEFYLRIRPLTMTNKKQFRTEHKYWKSFYNQFSYYLYKEAGCFDNYVGSCFKCIRCFFNYLSKERFLQAGEFHKQFYVTKENIPVIVLLPEQVKFLINNSEFVTRLSKPLLQTRQVVIFGCTVALRFSDIFRVRFSDIESINGQYYLSVRSLKTETETRIRLPEYVVSIIEERIKKRGKRNTMFEKISLHQFNKNLRSMVEAAGWTKEIMKTRNKRGMPVLLNTKNHTFRFCDLVSSHIMRRTAITTMLMLGMPEYIVRKISGHSANSKAFYRYVSFAQSYLDTETSKVFEQLVAK